MLPSRSGWLETRMAGGGGLIAALALFSLLQGCVPSSSGARDTITISAYSVAREAFHEGLVPAFAALWKAKTGRDLEFVESYNSSGAQVRALKSGFDADLVVLSHSDDMDQLVRAGLVRSDWRSGRTKGIVTHSLVVIGHRPGNPKGIHNWSDLERAGVGVLYPDPKTSGGARWNINALYGSAVLDSRRRHAGKVDIDEVKRKLAKIQANVINMDSSGRQSMANFVDRGIGDAVISYENELIFSNKQGKEIPYVIPPRTLLIESPIALVEGAMKKHGNEEVVREFERFVLGEEGQAILAGYGFRRLDSNLCSATEKPLPLGVFTMDELGGWSNGETLYGPEGHWTAIFKDGLGRVE